MTEKKRKTRRYDSTRRQEQARQTRRLITEAARKLFLERGYAGASIAAIAQEAGVAPETVYATFGSKSAILSHVADVLLVGDDEPVGLLERPEIKSTSREPDQHTQIMMFAGHVSTIMGRSAAIMDIIRTAAKTEPDIAEMHAKRVQERRGGMRFFLNGLTSYGPLREGVNMEQATDIVYSLTSAGMVLVLTVDLGWSPQQYAAWLADTLIRTLLPD